VAQDSQAIKGPKEREDSFMNEKLVIFEPLGQTPKDPFEVFVTPLMVPEVVLKSHGYKDCCLLKTSGFLIRDGDDLYREIESGDRVYVVPKGEIYKDNFLDGD